MQTIEPIRAQGGDALAGRLIASHRTYKSSTAQIFRGTGWRRSGGDSLRAIAHKNHLASQGRRAETLWRCDS